ncbi:hypothetical protein J6590_017003 [Homalodisca vitripennis]|nr:hypothetical protein J6590_017003 [Homalodisca vitripennis]
MLDKERRDVELRVRSSNEQVGWRSALSASAPQRGLIRHFAVLQMQILQMEFHYVPRPTPSEVFHDT